jgi:hypothetical protein
MRTKENLTSLCGLTGEETKLDFRRQRLGVGGAMLIANDIKDNGALIKLDISKNRIPSKRELQHICAAGGIDLAIQGREGMPRCNRGNRLFFVVRTASPDRHLVRVFAAT